MSAYVSVPDFFASVYLVDFSPSLCDVARKRFERLGWKNVKVVCQDARTFRLEDHEVDPLETIGFSKDPMYFGDESSSATGADLITMSYSLSMIVRAWTLFGGDRMLTTIARLLFGHRFHLIATRTFGHHWCRRLLRSIDCRPEL